MQSIRLVSLYGALSLARGTANSVNSCYGSREVCERDSQTLMGMGTWGQLGGGSWPCLGSLLALATCWPQSPQCHSCEQAAALSKALTSFWTARGYIPSTGAHLGTDRVRPGGVLGHKYSLARQQDETSSLQPALPFSPYPRPASGMTGRIHQQAGTGIRLCQTAKGSGPLCRLLLALSCYFALPQAHPLAASYSQVAWGPTNLWREIGSCRDPQHKPRRLPVKNDCMAHMESV